MIVRPFENNLLQVINGFDYLALYFSSTACSSINGFRNSSRSYMDNWLAASHNALVGSGCTSIKIPSTPAATPALPSTGKNSLLPPLASELGIPYLRTACVMSNTTGYPN